MTPFKSFPFALLLALGFVSSAASAAEYVTRAPGEPLLGAKAQPVVSFRATTVPVQSMTLGDLDLMRIANVQKRNRRENVPVQIGIKRDVSEAVAALPALRWTKVTGGSVARFEVSSPDALALRVGLKVASLPDGAEVRVAGSLAPDVVRFETSEQVRRMQKQARTYWTPTTDGDRQTIEFFLPTGSDPKQVSVQVSTVSHLLTNSLEHFSLAKAIGDSGSCNVDVVCRVNTLGQNYVDTKNSVARMVFEVNEGGPDDGTFTCTGTLLADTVTASQIPYFYTADHCVGNQAVASTLETYWGFEATTCGGSTPAANTLVGGGADYLYSEVGDEFDTTGNATDASLLRLRSTPPNGAYFSGWNANTIPDDTGAVLAVHHPSGDLKKSSLGTKLSHDANLYEMGWLSGTTEGGSSGSGLFTPTGTPGNSPYELRGGLYGGFASCANSGDLSDTENRDYYSRLDRVYPDLQQWLAPSGTVAPGPTRDYTGAWYVPAESGWGLTAFQYDNAEKVLFVLFFVYDGTAAKWYEMDGSWTADDVRSGPVMQSTANQPWGTTYTGRTFASVGNATLTFTSATTATLNFTVNGVTRNVTLQKL